MPNLWIIFLTGLVTGGITCTAVQGGLLAAVIANTATNNQTDKTPRRRKIQLIMIVIAFVGAKLLSHTLLGFVLGLMGGKLQITVQFTSFMLAVASIFMIGLGLNMLSIHPVFRRFTVTTPRFFRKLLWKQSKRTDLLAPIALGALTIFIPCGVTQAMMAQAIGYGNAVTGSLILFSFILGTTPFFIIFGLAVTTLTERYKQLFEKAAAFLIIGMAIWNLYNVSTIFGIDREFSQIIRPVACQIVYCEDEGIGLIAKTPTKTPEITIRQTAYEIDNSYIPGGEDITLTVVNKDGFGCIQFFTIPKLGIQKPIPVGKTEIFTFTSPKEKGELLFTCSMGMYRGRFIVQ